MGDGGGPTTWVTAVKAAANPPASAPGPKATAVVPPSDAKIAQPKPKAERLDDQVKEEGVRVEVVGGKNAGHRGTVIKVTGEGKDMRWRVKLDDVDAPAWADAVKRLPPQAENSSVAKTSVAAKNSSPATNSSPAKAPAAAKSSPLGEGATVEVG